jgi:hypothetical protein
MGSYCPFCLGARVKVVGGQAKARSAEFKGTLMECEECEKWYWADREKEAAALFRHCQTPSINPGRCYQEVRDVVLSPGLGSVRMRLAEFNHLCAECPNARFRPGPVASEQRRPSKFSSL